MKSHIISSALFLSLCLNGFSQSSYVKSIDNSFVAGNNGSWTGNLATEVVKSINSVDGIMDVAVVKAPGSWSIIGNYANGCWSDKLVLDQSNRYFECRVKCSVAQTTPMKIYPKWGNCDACCPENKTFPTMSFTIPEADVWTTVFKKVPPTTGGTQNVIDTLGSWFALELENGNYQFDYIKIGDAAKPPVPTIDKVKTKTNTANTLITVNLSNISIPGRPIDGLTISAEALQGDYVLTDINVLDLGAGPFAVDEMTNIATAALQYKTVEGMTGLGDSIIITLKDTIRGTTTKTSFYVNLICGCEPPYTGSANLAIENLNIYPTPTTGILKIDLPEAIIGNISIIDMIGNTFSSQIIAQASAVIDITSAAPGMYIVKISDGKDVVTRKIVKQ